MVADPQKLAFLKNEFIPLLQKLETNAKGSWGVLNAQQMVEHFTDSIQSANGKRILPAVYEGEKLEKTRQFMFSETPFPENTRNSLMNETGDPIKQPDMSSAIVKLKEELDYFFEIFEKDSSHVTQNPFFGELDFGGNVHLLHKHAMHHLRQFGLI